MEGMAWAGHHARHLLSSCRQGHERGCHSPRYPPMCFQRRAPKPTRVERAEFGVGPRPLIRVMAIAGRYHYTHLAPTIPLSLPTQAVSVSSVHDKRGLKLHRPRRRGVVHRKERRHTSAVCCACCEKVSSDQQRLFSAVCCACCEKVSSEQQRLFAAGLFAAGVLPVGTIRLDSRFIGG